MRYCKQWKVQQSRQVLLILSAHILKFFFFQAEKGTLLSHYYNFNSPRNYFLFLIYLFFALSLYHRVHCVVQKKKPRVKSQKCEFCWRRHFLDNNCNDSEIFTTHPKSGFYTKLFCRRRYDFPLICRIDWESRRRKKIVLKTILIAAYPPSQSSGVFAFLKHFNLFAILMHLGSCSFTFFALHIYPSCCWMHYLYAV